MDDGSSGSLSGRGDAKPSSRTFEVYSAYCRLYRTKERLANVGFIKMMRDSGIVGEQVHEVDLDIMWMKYTTTKQYETNECTHTQRKSNVATFAPFSLPQKYNHLRQVSENARK